MLIQVTLKVDSCIECPLRRKAMCHGGGPTYCIHPDVGGYMIIKNDRFTFPVECPAIKEQLVCDSLKDK